MYLKKTCNLSELNYKVHSAGRHQTCGRGCWLNVCFFSFLLFWPQWQPIHVSICTLYIFGREGHLRMQWPWATDTLPVIQFVLHILLIKKKKRETFSETVFPNLSKLFKILTIYIWRLLVLQVCLQEQRSSVRESALTNRHQVRVSSEPR